jgi:hypothetical protein
LCYYFNFKPWKKKGGNLLKRYVRACIILLALVLLNQPSRPDDPAEQKPPKTQLPDLRVSSPVSKIEVRADLDFGQMPVYFVANRGQFDKEVAFCAQGKDKTLYFTSKGLTFALSSPEALKENSHLSIASRSTSNRREIQANDEAPHRWVVKLDFVGADPDVHPVGRDEAGALISYFKGKPKEWHRGLPTYSRIVYPNGSFSDSLGVSRSHRG